MIQQSATEVSGYEISMRWFSVANCRVHVTLNSS